MKVEYYKLDPTGNITLIVKTPVPRAEQCELAKRLMRSDPEAEQVGFIEKAGNEDAVMRLQMMGGEFCGNAALSAASVYAREHGMEKGSLCLEVSGIGRTLSVSVEKLGADVYSGCVAMPLPESVQTVELDGLRLPVVRFQGISHIISDGLPERSIAEAGIKQWCEKLGAEALGVMFIESGRLEPLVYVAATDTVVWENSCASGTTAAAAYYALKDGRSGEYGFLQKGGTLSCKAELSDGIISALIMKGRARIAGEYSVTLP